MLNNHAKAGIALIAFYLPTVIIARQLIFHRRPLKRLPRLAWIVLLVFCIVRLASGIVVLLHGIYPDSTGLTVASIILLNVGVFPIIAATIGLVQIIKFMDFSESKSLHYGIAFSRVLFITGVGLLVAGGVLEGMADPSSVQTGLQLAEAGYIIVAVFVGCVFGFETFFWTHHARLSHPSRTALKGATSAIPFFVVRLTYAFLSVFRSSEPKWNSLSGSIASFVTMALVMEYIVVCIYLYTGFVVVVRPSADGPGRVWIATGDEESGVATLGQPKQLST